jgi:hypothetical protein
MKADALTYALRLSVRLFENRDLGIKRTNEPGITGPAPFPLVAIVTDYFDDEVTDL